MVPIFGDSLPPVLNETDTGQALGARCRPTLGAHRRADGP